jgi:hypothetical protein
VVLALGLIAALVGLSLALFSASNRYLQQARLDALAENASIAAADALRGLVAGTPCEAARKVALSGESRIISCSIIGTDLLIKLENDGMQAKARAGEPETPQN